MDSAARISNEKDDIPNSNVMYESGIALAIRLRAPLWHRRQFMYAFFLGH
jgi:hypothetical protein